MAESPLLVMAGSADQVAPPKMVQPWIDAVASVDTTWVEAGIAHGFSADYGHLDLPLGDHVGMEIYPIITEWLFQRAPMIMTESEEKSIPAAAVPAK